MAAQVRHDERADDGRDGVKMRVKSRRLRLERTFGHYVNKDKFRRVVSKVRKRG